MAQYHDAHCDTLARVMGIHSRNALSAQSMFSMYMREAKDIGAQLDPPLELLPVWDWRGFWTVWPTDYVRLRDQYQRHLAMENEAKRKARNYPRSSSLGRLAMQTAQHHRTKRREIALMLPDDIPYESDACLARIQCMIDKGSLVTTD
jgi:hypothetical protein